MNYWGFHTLLDCAAGDIAKVTDADYIRSFAKELVKRIDMVAYGEPQVIHFGQGDLGGLTLIQLIETSNITAHFIDHNGDFYMDVFSCKSYDTKIVTDTVQEFFSPKTMRVSYLTRQA